MCYGIPCPHWNDWAETCTKPRWDPCPEEKDDGEAEDYGDGLTEVERARQDEELSAWEESRDLERL